MLLKLNHIEIIFEQSKQYLPYFFAFFFIVEALVVSIKIKTYFTKETTVNILTGAVTYFTQTILKTYFLYTLFPLVYVYRIYTFQNFWISLSTAFLLYTFIQFIIHLLSHKVRILWCIHEVHHSATLMNLSTGIRSSIFNFISLEFIYLLIPFLGIDPMFYFLIYVFSKFWGTIIHMSEHILKHRSIFNKLIVTPTVHHVHHASNGSYVDKNFGEIVPWFDLLFGTYSPYQEPIVYGTAKVQQQIGFWESQTHEFKALFADIKSTKNVSEKLKYLFMPPNWRP